MKDAIAERGPEPITPLEKAHRSYVRQVFWLGVAVMSVFFIPGFSLKMAHLLAHSWFQDHDLLELSTAVLFYPLLSGLFALIIAIYFKRCFGAIALFIVGSVFFLAYRMLVEAAVQDIILQGEFIGFVTGGSTPLFFLFFAFHVLLISGLWGLWFVPKSTAAKIIAAVGGSGYLAFSLFDLGVKGEWESGIPMVAPLWIYEDVSDVYVLISDIVLAFCMLSAALIGVAQVFRLKAAKRLACWLGDNIRHIILFAGEFAVLFLIFTYAVDPVTFTRQGEPEWNPLYYFSVVGFVVAVCLLLLSLIVYFARPGVLRMLVSLRLYLRRRNWGRAGMFLVFGSVFLSIVFHFLFEFVGNYVFVGFLVAMRTFFIIGGVFLMAPLGIAGLILNLHKAKARSR